MSTPSGPLVRVLASLLFAVPFVALISIGCGEGDSPAVKAQSEEHGKKSDANQKDFMKSYKPAAAKSSGPRTK